MADRPIIFSAPMVRALLDGRKTQTRRVLGGLAESAREAAWHAIRQDDGAWAYVAASVEVSGFMHCGERYAVGDRLWVREAWSHRGTGVWTITAARMVGRGGVIYRSDAEVPGAGYWPSIHMPREFSRLTLIVTDVRVQRLQEISEENAVAEGAGQYASSTKLCAAFDPSRKGSYREGFRELWGNLHGPDAWSANPWVVALTFTVEQRNIDALREVA